MASTFTAKQNALSPPGDGLAGTAKIAFGKYTFGTAAVINDLVNICKLPAGALVVGGSLMADDIDTGTETLEIDVGYLANGGGSETLVTYDGTEWTNTASSGSAVGFVDSGVLVGDGVTDLIPAGMNFRPFQLKTGPKYFSRETQVQAKVTAAANATGTGTVYVRIDYIIVG